MLPTVHNGGVMVLVRTDSHRLAGKCYHRIDGRPVLEHLLHRIVSRPGVPGAKNNSNHWPVVLVTTARSCDRGLAVLCRRAGCGCIRTFTGAVDDVLGRIDDALQQLGWSYFIRISGDSPWIDRELIAAVHRQWHRNGGQWDVLSTVWPKRLLPSGLSVEVVRAEALHRLRHLDLTPSEQEHVTLGFYRRPDVFRLATCRSVAASCPGLAKTQKKWRAAPHRRRSLSVDTVCDLNRVRRARIALTPSCALDWRVDEVWEASR